MEKIGLTNLKWFWLHNLRSWMHFDDALIFHCVPYLKNDQKIVLLDDL